MTHSVYSKGIGRPKGRRAHCKIQAEDCHIPRQQDIEGFLSISPTAAVAVTVDNNRAAVLRCGVRWLVMAATQLEAFSIHLQGEAAVSGQHCSPSTFWGL